MGPQMLRRLSDKIVAAHKQACEENCMDVANLLMQALELHVSTIGGESAENRTSMPEIEEAFELHESSK
ncbi:MAG: hypothetical protein HOH04_07340 [Rhodospirillaceae bacterium]|jgi:hypothetical protein|nr:hypothetical protein [Rhodospirillaceae bacterium]